MKTKAAMMRAEAVEENPMDDFHQLEDMPEIRVCRLNRNENRRAESLGLTTEKQTSYGRSGPCEHQR